MSTFITWNDLKDETQLTIHQELEDRVAEELENECMEYKTTRATQKTNNGLLYSEAPWQEIAKTEYDFETDSDFEAFYMNRADEILKAWRGVEITI